MFVVNHKGEVKMSHNSKFADKQSKDAQRARRAADGRANKKQALRRHQERDADASMKNMDY
jgi:hypothetical protein